MAMLDNVKLLCNSTNEPLLNLLIEQSKAAATDYCHLAAYSTKLDGIVEQMVCERFNKLSAEGISSRSYSSISESYTDDYSPAIYTALNKHRKIRLVGGSNV